MTELRQRMLNAMVQRGFAARTQETYISAIRRMARHYRRDPATYTAEEVQAYLASTWSRSRSSPTAA